MHWSLNSKHGGSAARLFSCHSAWQMPLPRPFYSLLMCTSLCLYRLLDLILFFGHFLLEIILNSAIAIVHDKIVEGFIRIGYIWSKIWVNVTEISLNTPKQDKMHRDAWHRLKFVHFGLQQWSVINWNKMK